MDERVHCDIHGERALTIVCHHIVEGTALLWRQAEPPTKDNPFPDAWCEKCEVQFINRGGWTDESLAFADLQVLCDGCYQRIRAEVAATQVDDTALDFAYKCGACDAVHRGLPDWGAPAPDVYFEVPEKERDQRFELTTDICISDDEHYFVRGVLDLPILQHRARFSFGVWVSLGAESFERVLREWDDPARVLREPDAGWLATHFPGRLFCGKRSRLRVHVYQREPGQRPLVSLQPTDHPLARVQHNGFTIADARRLAEHLLTDRGGQVLH